jgi:carbon monoxide dehydrogenase subunit G
VHICIFVCKINDLQRLFSGIVDVDAVNNEIEGALLFIDWHVRCNVYIGQAHLGTQNIDKFEM